MRKFEEMVTRDERYATMLIASSDHLSYMILYCALVTSFLKKQISMDTCIDICYTFTLLNAILHLFESKLQVLFHTR